MKHLEVTVRRFSKMKPYFWSQYSSILREKILHPKFVGSFTVKEAESRRLFLAIGKQGGLAQGVILYLYWLVRENDGIILDAKFQVYGPASFIASAEIICELCKGKNYDQASRISSDLIDQSVKQKSNQSGFPKEDYSFLNFTLAAIDEAVYQCRHIPFVATYDETPIHQEFGAEKIIEDFFTFNLEKQRKIVEEILDKEIRPYIELDAGGIQVKDIQGEEITVMYEGACTTCPSSIGSTLTAIQKILQTRIHPNLRVNPEF